MNESDTRLKLIDPALASSSWTLEQIHTEYNYTAGEIVVRGAMVSRKKSKKVDYLLSYVPDVPIAVVEAKDTDHSVGAGMARIRDERRRLVAAGKAKAPKGGESVICRGEDGSWYERRGKGEPRCIDKEVPFDIPEGWEWARLGAICVLARGNGIKRCETTKDGLPWHLLWQPSPLYVGRAGTYREIGGVITMKVILISCPTSASPWYDAGCRRGLKCTSHFAAVEKQDKRGARRDGLAGKPATC